MRKLIWVTCLLIVFSNLIPLTNVDAKSKIAIVFIIDRSGSMGYEINNVKNNIESFADLLEQEGIDYQLGLLSYEENVTQFPLTSDVNEFKTNVGSINASGGIENGLDAIMDAINNYTYELNSSKYFIVIGDEVLHSKRGYTNEEVIAKLKENDIILSEISLSESNLRSGPGNFYSHTGGQWLNINANFYNNLTEIFDQIQALPIVEILSPSANQVFGENDTAFIPSVKVSDPDSDTLTFHYYIDSETTPRDTKTITNTKTAQNVSFNAIDMGALSEGQHRMTFIVDDGSDTVTDYVDFYVDKTPPSLGNVSMTSTDTSIHISGSASDQTSGMSSSPYRYTVGSTVTGWTNQTTYSKSNLTPNTKYFVKFEAQDNSGLIASKSQHLYTKAQIPTVNITNNTETSLDISLQDQNPSGTAYQIKVGTGYVNSSGTLSSSAVWITPTSKTIRVTGLTPNRNYYIQARAQNHANLTTSFSQSVRGTTLAEPPQNIETDIQQRTITLSWPATSGVTYQIEVDGHIYNNGTSTTYFHDRLNPNTQHTYRVRVVNGGGAGNWSSLLNLTTLPDPPAVPIGVTATESQTEVEVVWDSVAAATAYDVEVDGQIIENGNQTTFIHKGLNPETQHTYRVRAKNSGGISNWSQALTVTTLPYPPEKPVNITTEITKNSVSLSWPAVERAVAYELKVDGLIIENEDKTTYFHGELQPLSGHTYQVRAKNRGGKGPWSDPIDVTTYPEEPDTPGNVMTTASETEITVTWYQVEHAASYEVEIDGQSVVTVTESQFTHTNLQPDSRHTYRVRAKNISGYSEWSTPVAMRTFPTGDGTQALTNVVAVVTNTDITISWETVAPDAQYEIEVDGVLMDNGVDTIYQHGGLNPNEYHSYRIRLKNVGAANNWVAVLSLSTLPNPPDAPTSLEAFATNNSIELRWEKVDGATAYEIEVDGQTIEVGNEQNYVHDGLVPGTSHTYRVRAKNVTGVTAWSPALEKSTTSPVYTINVKNGENFDFTLLGSNIQDFSELTFVVTYNPEEIELVDLYDFTPEKDMIVEGQIPGTNISVKQSTGRIEFTINQNVVPSTSWSGEITTLEFKSKIDGQTKIDFVVE